MNITMEVKLLHCVIIRIPIIIGHSIYSDDYCSDSLTKRSVRRRRLEVRRIFSCGCNKAQSQHEIYQRVNVHGASTEAAIEAVSARWDTVVQDTI